jgi:hypothetical protein
VQSQVKKNAERQKCQIYSSTKNATPYFDVLTFQQRETLIARAKYLSTLYDVHPFS